MPARKVDFASLARSASRRAASKASARWPRLGGGKIQQPMRRSDPEHAILGEDHEALLQRFGFPGCDFICHKIDIIVRVDNKRLPVHEQLDRTLLKQRLIERISEMTQKTFAACDPHQCPVLEHGHTRSTGVARRSSRTVPQCSFAETARTDAAIRPTCQGPS